MDRGRHPARGADRPTRARPALRPPPAHRPELPHHGATHHRRPARRDLGRPDAVRYRTRKPLTANRSRRRSRQHGCTTFAADRSARCTRRSKRPEKRRSHVARSARVSRERRLERGRGFRGAGNQCGCGGPDPSQLSRPSAAGGRGIQPPPPAGAHQPERVEVRRRRGARGSFSDAALPNPA
jgi:hypothetical protein